MEHMKPTSLNESSKLTGHRPETPHLQLTLWGAEQLSTTLPYQLEFTITRQDTHDDPVTFRWSPDSDGFSLTGFKLFRRTANGLELIEVDHSGLIDISKKPDDKVTSHEHHIWDLDQDDNIQFWATLPERYHKHLEPGQQYILLWPGSEIAAWDWGEIEQHIGEELNRQPERLVLPGGPRVSFTVAEESIPWPERAEREAQVGFDNANLAEQKWRLEEDRVRAPLTVPHTFPSQHDAEAPNLKVTLECPSILRRRTPFDVSVKLTYNADATAQPVVFHNYIFNTDEYLEIHQLEGEDWVIFDSDSGTGWQIWDDPDVFINVGQDDNFVSLRPGESWTTSHRIQSETWTEFHDDMADGDAFRFIFQGATVDWWNWGVKEDYDGTMLRFPCNRTGRVLGPSDNDGRPSLVVPSSNLVECTVRE